MARPDPRSPRVDNGLRASAYVPLADVDAAIGATLLQALGRARIAAYLAADAGPADPGSDDPGPDATRRLFVASDDRVDARGVVEATVRGLGGDPSGLPPQRDPGDDADTRTTFDSIVADWHVDTVAAVRDAERDLTREDADWRSRLGRPPATDEVWLDEDHYVPPAPPPLPRFSTMAIFGVLGVVVGIVLLALGTGLGLAEHLTLVLGILAILGGVALLFTRISTHRRDDEDDDGAAI